VKAASPEAVVRPPAGKVQVVQPPAPVTRWQRFPGLPLVLILIFVSIALLPRLRGNERLVQTFLGVGGVLLAWALAVWVRARRRGQALRIEFTPVKAHWVQACVQASIIVYWGLTVREVFAEAPLIVAQLLYMYVFDALMSWTRGRSWRLGFGPFPIVFSTNLLLWFRDDYFYGQFAMLTLGALGKEFIKWNREGRRTHIFNPSVFGQSLVAVALILTDSAGKLTWGSEIAANFGTPPHMYLCIFLGGLVVQYLFQVTLMTVAAAAVLCAFNLAYTHATGSYYFAVTNIGAPIFLGIHLLVTDPSTSPRSNLGRVMFGVLYAAGFATFYRLLDSIEGPIFFDKLLPVGILNLLVPAIDRFAHSGAAGRLNRAWETRWQPRRANLVHMGCWAALFFAMWSTGFIEGPHPGNSMLFWKRAYDEGKPHAGPTLLKMAAFGASQGNATAYEILGELHAEGRQVPRSTAVAARYFARACDLGNAEGCRNLARLFVQGEEMPQDVAARALDQLEQKGAATDGEGAFVLGLAYETGRGRPLDPARARALYEDACRRGHAEACRRLQSTGSH
jgi:hypothetical protein